MSASNVYGDAGCSSGKRLCSSVWNKNLRGNLFTQLMYFGLHPHTLSRAKYTWTFYTPFNIYVCYATVLLICHISDEGMEFEPTAFVAQAHIIS